MVKEFREYKGFLELLQTFNISSNAYLSFEYYSVLCDHYPPGNNFICFAAYDETENLIGLLPLTKRKFDYVILGYRFSNYLGYICSDEDVEKVDAAITDYMKKTHPGMVLTFYDINDREVLYSLIDQDKMSKKIFLYHCPFCDVSVDFDTFFKSHITKSKKRSELKKFDRKLQELGEIKVLNIDNEAKWEKGKKYFDQIFKIHQERFQDVYIPTDLCLHNNCQYYTELFESMVKSGKAYISIMLLDEKVISFVYTAISNDIIVDWMPAFDPAFAKYNLGTVHMMHIMEYACGNDNYRIFDFSKGDGSYKDRWANQKTSSYMFVRRYSNRLCPLLKQGIIYYPFVIKGWLRKKGILRLLKAWLGKRKTSSAKIKNLDIKYNSEINCADIKKFNYSDIAEYDVSDRREVLEHSYAGDAVNEIFQDGALQIVITTSNE